MTLKDFAAWNNEWFFRKRIQLETRNGRTPIREGRMYYGRYGLAPKVYSIYEFGEITPCTPILAMSEIEYAFSRTNVFKHSGDWHPMFKKSSGFFFVSNLRII